MTDVIRKIFCISRTRTLKEFFEVEAKTKKEALELFEEDYYEALDTDFVREGQPKLHSTTVIIPCPNRGEAWSDIPLPLEEKKQPGSWGWHYNGRCEGEMSNTQTHCSVCRRAMRKGNRLLTLEEKRYLMDRYPGDKPLLLVD